MKILRLLKKSVTDAFKGVFRNFSLSIASIFCIIITLLLVSVSIILSSNLNNITKQIEKDLTVVVFMNKEATEEDVVSLKTKLEGLNNVASIKYESKEDIKKQMGEESLTFKSIMDTWDENTNPLKNSFLIKVNDVTAIGETSNQIKEFTEVSATQYGEGMVEQLISVFSVVEKVTVAVVIGMIAVSAFLISNTIKITIYNRRTEIEIMRLVGTSNFAIKFPHIIEGFIIGILGSIIPVIVTIYGYTILYANSNGYIFSRMFTLIKPDNFVLVISLILALIGSSVGMLGSYRAVRKHLKV